MFLINFPLVLFGAHVSPGAWLHELLSLVLAIVVFTDWLHTVHFSGFQQSGQKQSRPLFMLISAYIRVCEGPGKKGLFIEHLDVIVGGDDVQLILSHLPEGPLKLQWGPPVQHHHGGGPRQRQCLPQQPLITPPAGMQ